MKLRRISCVLLGVLLVLLCACHNQLPAQDLSETQITTKYTTLPNVSHPDTKTVTCLKIEWDAISKETKALLEKCGISKEQLIVDKSKLTYEENPPTLYHPSYAMYKKDDFKYSFLDLYGNLTSVRFPYREISEADYIPDEEILYRAEKIANLFIDTKEYNRTEGKVLDSKEFLVYYTKQMAGYDTLSMVRLVFGLDGKLKAYYVSKIGLWDNVTAPKINEKEIDRQCVKVLKEKYHNYDSHTVKMRTLDIKDGQFYYYYKDLPEIQYGQMVMICECYPVFTDGTHGRGEFVVIPLA